MAQELKTYDFPVDHGDFTATVEQFYLKSEADKVISELKESHKMEVEQLLIEIAELKQKRDTAENLLNKALYCVSNGKNHMMSLARKNNHANHKRCLAMAAYCHTNVHCIMGHRLCALADWKKEWFERWRKRWLELAEKFKEAT